MSTATIKDLIPGEAAASADVNSTLSSFVTACAAGAINGDNVRVEGIDRRTLSATGHVVERWYADPVNMTTWGPVQSLGAYSVVNTMVLTSVTLPTTVHALLHCSACVRGTPAVALLQEIYLQLQESADGGATFTALPLAANPQATAHFAMANTAPLCDQTPGNNVPAACASIAWCIPVTAYGQARIYRLAFMTTVSDVTFDSGTIFLEVLGV